MGTPGAGNKGMEVINERSSTKGDGLGVGGAEERQ